MRSLVLLLILASRPALAQQGFPPFAGGGAPITRSIPLNTSGNVASTLAAYGTTPTACWKFDEAVGATIATNCGGSYTATVSGTPTLVGTFMWPAGIAGAAGKAWFINGGTDYITRSDTEGGDAFDPAGSFSVVCALRQRTTTTNRGFIGKGTVAGSYGWYFRVSGSTQIGFYVSDDGTTQTSNVAAGYAFGMPSFFTHTYQYVGAANSVSTFYIDNQATDTSNAQRGPVYDNTGEFRVGMSTSVFEGDIYFCAYYNGVVLTEAQHDAAFATWQGRAPVYGGVATVANSAPMAIAMAPQNSGIEPFIIQQPANSQYLRNGLVMKGLCSPGAVTNETWRRSFESPAAPGAPTGWTLGGTGAGLTLVNSTAHSAHGTQSLLATSNGSGAMTAASGCNAITKNTLYQMDAWAMSTAGTGDAKLSLVEDQHNDCASPDSITDVVTIGNYATWTQPFGTITTSNPAGTLYGRVLITFNATAQTTHIDAVSLYANATRHIGFCPGDTDADAVCTASSISVTNPISWLGNTSVTGTFSGPNAGTVLAADAYLWAAGTPGAGNDKVNAYVDSTTDEPGITIRDSAGGVLSTEPDVTNWTGAEVVLKWKFDNLGTLLSEYWNSAWNSTTAGAGTGIRAASQATMYLGGDGTTGSDICFHDITVQRKLVP